MDKYKKAELIELLKERDFLIEALRTEIRVLKNTIQDLNEESQNKNV